MKKSILTGILTTVLVSTCAAQNWYPVNVPTNERLNDIEFASSTIGYIVGENGTFLKTTDGGQTWSNTNPTWNGNSFGTLSLLDISFVSETIGYLVLEGAQGTVKTLDGGQTWSDLPANTTNQCFANCVYSFAEDDLMIGGSDCFQGATITQFQTPTWTVQTVNYTTFDTNHKINQIDFEGNLGVAAINNEFMLRSVDFGQTWDTVSVGLLNGDVLTSVMIASNDTIYAGYDANGGGFGVLISTDNGLTWTQDFNSATFFYPSFYGITESNSGTVYVGAKPSSFSGGLIFSYGQGFWSYDNVDQPIYALDSYDSDVTFGVGDSGLVVVNVDFGSLGMNEWKDEINSLLVSPNPASNQITVSVSEGQIDEISVTDLHGREIQNQTIGNVSCTLDIDQLPAGLYILRARKGSYWQTEKFLKR